VAIARKTLGWDAPPFVIPEDIRAAGTIARPARLPKRNGCACGAATSANTAEGAEFERRMKGISGGLERPRAGGVRRGRGRHRFAGTRASSQVALNVLGPKMPEMLAVRRISPAR